MRLVKFLNEKEFTVEDIQKLCPEAWSLDLPLYRGMEIEEEVGKMKVRKDRKPTDTNQKFHELLDNAFNKIFGVKARSQCIFASGDMHQVAYFGNLFKIYIPNKFTCIWSDQIHDLYNIPQFYNLLQRKDKFTFTVYIIFACLHNDLNIIDINCKDFLVKNKLEKIKTPEQLIQEILSLYPDCFEKFVKKFYKKGNNWNTLQQAIQSKNEIMIDCDFYCFDRIH